MPKNRKGSDNRIVKGAMAAGAAMAGFFALVGRKIYSGVKFDKVTGRDDPNATVKRINNMKRVAVMIGLAILILIIIMLLLRGCQGGEPPHGSVDIPGNVIDPQPSEITPKADLEFNKDNAEENLSFDVEGMNGGDSESILYRVVATYNSDFVLKYDMTIREDEEFQKLAEILKIKVELMKTDGDALLYDGLLTDMSAVEMDLNADKDTTTEYLFRITMYLDAPLSEQYYGQKLIADMSWWIEAQDNISIANNEFTTISKTIPPDPPAITPNLSFITKNEGDNTAFDMRHIMNGDSQTRYFAFEVTHGEDIKMGIQNAIVTDSKLKEVLNVKVELVGENGNTTLYEGLLKDLTVEHTLAQNNSNKTTVYYKVTVTANGLTEAYCETKIVCDLSWSLIGTTEQLKVPNNSFIAYYKPVTPPDPPVITPDLNFVTVNEGDNTAFDMKDIENGDSQTRYFAFDVVHGEDIKVAIKNAITVDSNLHDVLKLKVELVGADGNTVLYEGLLKDLNAEHTLAKNADNKTKVYYKVTVIADGLTEAYCENKLICDLSWTLVGTTEQLKVSNNTFVAYDKPVTPPDPPVITPDLNFTQINEGDNTAFNMNDVENGDSQTKYFAFEVTHGEDIKVVIKNDVVLDSKLKEVLKVKVELVGENGNTSLYEGLLKDLNVEHTLTKNDNNKTAVYYKVTVIADGLTEDYCETKLVCDLSWSLDGTSEQLKVPSNSFVAYDKPVTPPDPPTPPEVATSIELTAKDGYENIPFDVNNILPGDSAAQYYCVSVTHDSTETVRFYINVDTAQKLTAVMRVKVEQLIPDAEDKILYDGLMKDCTAVDVSVSASSETVTPIYYRITVYTNGAEVGNEYAGESLTADFSWQLQ